MAVCMLLLLTIGIRIQVLGKNQMTKDGTCHAGVISYDVTLRGGMNAGKFTPHGKLNSMEMCIAKCCQSPLCSVAMMLKDACFTVECVKDEFCEKRPTPTSSKFNPRIAYVFRDRQINGKHFKHFGNSKKFKTKTLLNRNNSTLIFHPQTTSLKDNHEVLNGDHIKELKGKELLSTKSIPRNHIKKTDQAQYLNERPTEIKSNSFHTSNKNPQNLMHSVPFADDFDTQENSIKEKSDIYNIKERNSQNNTSLDALPAPMLKARIGNNKSEGNIQISHNIKKDAMKTLNYVPNNSINLSEVSKTKTMGTILSNSSEIKPASQMKFISNKEKISVTRNETKKDHEVISKELIPDEVPPIVPGLDDDAEDPSCTNSKTMYDVTLRGGMASGTFKDRGKLQYFSECLKICCIAGSCDLAFMLGDNCYSVQCHSERLCEAVPARSSKFSPRIAYIYARTA